MLCQLTSIISNQVWLFLVEIESIPLWKLLVLVYFFDLFCFDAHVRSPWKHF